VFLLDTLDVKPSGLVHELYSKHVLNPVERDDIIAEQTSFRANEKLLSVLSRKSPQQFQLFLDALDNCGQQHVRNVIADRRPGLYIFLIIYQVIIVKIFSQFKSITVCTTSVLEKAIIHGSLIHSKHYR